MDKAFFFYSAGFQDEIETMDACFVVQSEFHH